MKFIPLILVLLSLISSSCNKIKVNCIDNGYSFKISAKLFPDRDSVHTGDTIWLEIITPTSLTDISSNKLIDYSGALNLDNAIGFIRFTGDGSFSDPGGIYSANDFTVNATEGRIVNNPATEGFREFSFSENNNLYWLKIAIVPEKTGIYAIALSDGVNVNRASDKCTKSSFAVSIENTNQHLYFYQNNRPGYLISTYESEHMYCFKVY